MSFLILNTATLLHVFLNSADTIFSLSTGVFANVTMVGGTLSPLSSVPLAESFPHIAATFISISALSVHRSPAYISQYFSADVSFPKYSCILIHTFW